jgi:uncharacterized membrane protein
MALDHSREYFHFSGFANGGSPTDLETTTPILFFTRFITHFCAPIFVFLAGTSAFLYGQKKSKFQLSKFLFTRGLWLIVVEIVILNPIWWFHLNYDFINLQVIWTIGLSMISLGILIFLPKRLLLFLGILIIAGHNLLDDIEAKGDSFISILWYILHQDGYVSFSENLFVSFTYPVLPWIGVMVAGYIFGNLYRAQVDLRARKKWLIWLGTGSLLLFFLLRGTNIYGSPEPWTLQENPIFSIFSFLNLEKYPPSLNFLLLTLGTGFFFLYGVENFKNRVSSFFVVFGRVPFFYYVLHIFLIHLLALIALLLTGQDWQLMILSTENLMKGLLQGYGYPLWVTYLVSILAVAILYFPSKAYMKYKMENKTKWWLSYL